MKYLLITKSGVEILESEPDDAWTLLAGLKYPHGFISLTAMEDAEGPY